MLWIIMFLFSLLNSASLASTISNLASIMFLFSLLNSASWRVFLV